MTQNHAVVSKASSDAALSTQRASRRDGEHRPVLQRWRLWLSAALLVLMGLSALARALQEPSLGWRFQADDAGLITAHALHADLPTLNAVSGLASATLEVPLAPWLLIESAGIHNEYRVHNAFFAQHRLVWQVLHEGSEVRIAHAGGTLTVEPRARGLDELGLRFWFPWAVALLSLSVGLAAWVYRPDDLAARCLLLASAGYAFGMLCTTSWGSRLLTQSPAGWEALHVASHAASFAIGLGLCTLLWQLPTRLGGPWLPWLVFGVTFTSVLADGFQWVDTISAAFRAPIVAVNALIGVLFAAQWWAARGDPVKRAQLKWFGLLLFMGLSSVFVAYAYGATGRVVSIPQNFGLATVSLLFLGLVPLVGKVGLFRLEAWWPRAWLWFLGGLMVVGFDLALLAALDLSAESALALALAIGGWLYFPLRQTLWRRLSLGALPATRDLLPEILELVTLGRQDRGQLERRWKALWESAFLPPSRLSVIPVPDGTRVHADGAILRVQAPSGLSSLELDGALRGGRLFSESDRRRAVEIVRLVRHGLESHDAFAQGAAEERRRIAADLHDDLGARLLGIVHAAGDASRVQNLAREALQDMRAAVRGLSGQTASASDVVADWRADVVPRVEAAGMRCDWQADEPADLLRLSARLHVQLTRVLREAVSNTLQHSGADTVRVRVARRDARVIVEVADNGRGSARPTQANDEPGRIGHGLTSMRQRVGRLGGHFSIEDPGHGFTVRAEVPLGSAPPPDNAPS